MSNLENKELNDTDVLSKLAVIAESLKNLKDDLKELKNDFKDLDKIYTTKIEFTPVKNITFGLVTMMLFGMLTAILKIVIK